MLASAQSGRSVSEADIPPPLPSSATAETAGIKNTGVLILFLIFKYFSKENIFDIYETNIVMFKNYTALILNKSIVLNYLKIRNIKMYFI